MLVIGAPAAARAQVLTPAQASPKPAAQAAPAAAPDVEVPGSLFDEAPKQLLLGGRFSHISGDQARYQRYQDLRSGPLFTGARYAREAPDGLWLFRAAADNVGWRDQRFAATYEQPGRFDFSGLWDQIPQFYSVDTKTPYTDARRARCRSTTRRSGRFRTARPRSRRGRRWRRNSTCASTAISAT